MNWTVLVPFKGDVGAKTRLSDRLSKEERIALAQTMLAHLVRALTACPMVSEAVLVSKSPHETWPWTWCQDAGNGLNPALEQAALHFPRPLAVVHADLPLIGADDMAALFAAAEKDGTALAPDRHGAGTNALALADDRPFSFQFGPDSFSHHQAQCGLRRCVVVQRTGLASDCDTPEDLDILHL